MKVRAKEEIREGVLPRVRAYNWMNNNWELLFSLRRNWELLDNKMGSPDKLSGVIQS